MVQKVSIRFFKIFRFGAAERNLKWGGGGGMAPAPVVRVFYDRGIDNVLPCEILKARTLEIFFYLGINFSCIFFY